MVPCGIIEGFSLPYSTGLSGGVFGGTSAGFFSEILKGSCMDFLDGTHTESASETGSVTGSVSMRETKRCFTTTKIPKAVAPGTKNNERIKNLVLDFMEVAFDEVGHAVFGEGSHYAGT